MVPTSKQQLFTTFAIAAAIMAVSIAMPDSAHAGNWHSWFNQFNEPGRGAPEVDPSTIGSVVALAMGGLAVLTDKLRRR